MEFEAALSAALAVDGAGSRDPVQRMPRTAQGGRTGREEEEKKEAEAAGREELPRGTRRRAGFRPHPAHPAGRTRRPPGMAGSVPARPAVAVDGKERKLAKARGSVAKVHLLAAVTHVPGLVYRPGQGRQSPRQGERGHALPAPPLEPLPLDGVLVTSDAMQATRDTRLLPAESQEGALPAGPYPGQPAET